MALDLRTKYIAGYWILILASNYFSFLGFYKILTVMPGTPGEVAKRRTKWYFRIMNGLYVIALLLAFLPRFGPYCTATKVYPPCLNWASMLFIINFIFHVCVACKRDFFFSAGETEEEHDDYKAASAVDLDQSVADSQLSHQHWESREEHLHKKLF